MELDKMNTLKICVLHCPKQYVVYSPPQGLMSIAAYLKSKNVKIDVLDANIHYIDVDSIKLKSFNDFKNSKIFVFKAFNQHYMEFPEKELEKYFTEHKFDVIISDCHFTGTVNYSLQTFELIKRVSPESIIVCGGIHATYYSQKLLNTRLIDIVVKGEGEDIIYQIIQNLENDESLENIEGIDYLEEEHVKINPGIGFIKDLNTLAPTFKVFDDFEINLYREYVKALDGPFWHDRDPAGTVMLSRGCMGRCSFCNSRIVDQGKYRTLSEENTIMNIKSIYELYEPKKITIYDALFGANKRQFRAFCNVMKEIQIPWEFATRVDLLKTEDIELLKESYCRNVIFGLESVNLDTLKFNGKISHKKTDKYITTAVKTFKQVIDSDMFCLILLLFGMPKEKPTIYEDTIKFFKENDLINEKIMVKAFMPISFPGSLLWDLTPPDQRCHDWEKYNMNPENPISTPKIFYNNSDFTLEELYNYGLSIENDLFENSDMTDNKLLLRDLKIIIDEGYDAIESKMDKDWFELSIDYTVKNYLSSK